LLSVGRKLVPALRIHYLKDGEQRTKEIIEVLVGILPFTTHVQTVPNVFDLDLVILGYVFEIAAVEFTFEKIDA
jgi:hypothetical protein